MRIIVIFIILILIGTGLYTGYGVLTFEPEKPRPLVFQEPTSDSLRALGLLPKDSKDAATLTPEQQDQTAKAVTKISDAITIYRQLTDTASLKLKSTLEILNGAMASGKLPAYFLSVKDSVHPQRKFEMLTYNPKNAMEIPASPATLACSDAVSILVGNDGPDNLGCTFPAINGDRIFIGGPGDDTISNSFGNTIVNPGSGDDTITLGPGRSIIVLDESWGHDVVKIDCKGSQIDPSEVPKDFSVPWIAPYTNFIVLSPRISKADVKWNGDVLTNSRTGDTLSVNQNCFTLIGSE